MEIRPYQPDTDKVQAYALWQRALGSVWPISRQQFQLRTAGHEAYQAGDALIAEAQGQLVGFIGTSADPPRGQMSVILVDPARQRQGIGTALHDRALERLRQRGVTEVQLGAGGPIYFWPGVPTNLPAAWAFFQKRGWAERERSCDLIQPLAGYRTPPEVLTRIRLPGVTITTATPADVPAVLAFEAHHFPEWRRYFEIYAEERGPDSLALARNAQREIIGTALVDAPRPEQPPDTPWETLLGTGVGGGGTVGVAEAWRENGVGLAIAARVTELLKERGCAVSYVGYTWLVDWYGRLGYTVWREYHMSWRNLTSRP
jgi:beta-N-acetylhexosaminidase